LWLTSVPLRSTYAISDISKTLYNSTNCLPIAQWTHKKSLTESPPIIYFWALPRYRVLLVITIGGGSIPRREPRLTATIPSWFCYLLPSMLLVNTHSRTKLESALPIYSSTVCMYVVRCKSTEASLILPETTWRRWIK
jgi:hypothetical protein